MTFEEFDLEFDSLIAECRQMRDAKGKEYANGQDRFGNFKRISQRLGVKPTAVCMVYLTKHLDSIESFIKTGKIHSNERIRGRIVDAITYLTLLHGLFMEDAAEAGE